MDTSETIRAVVHARLPDELRITDRMTPWLRARQVLQAGRSSFLEGPAIDRSGSLFCTDIPFGRIFRILPGERFEVFLEYDGEPNGLKVHKDGRLFVTDHKRGLLAIDPRSKAVSTIAAGPASERFRGVNDLHFASNGDLYFTDQGQSGLQQPNGRLFRLSRDGELVLLLDGIPGPNGLVLDRSETSLFLAVTRANAIWRVPLDPKRGVGKVGVFVHLSGGIGPDGLAMDSQDNLLVAHTGRGTVWVFDPFGEIICRVLSPTRGGRTTNLAFGGDDHRTLFITESDTGQILSAQMPIPGRPMFSHQ